VMRVRVACRNLSRGGVSILHSSYVHPGSPCRITLPHSTAGQLTLSGKIVRCVHRGGVVHEIGISFDEPVNVREFLNPPPLSNLFTLERIEPGALRGVVRLVDAEESDRQRFAHYLRETKLTVQACATLDEALQNDPPADVLFLSTELPEANLAAAVEKIRSALGCCIVLVAPDAGERSRERVRGVQARLAIAKPMTQDVLLLSIAEVMVIQHHQAPRLAEALRGAPDEAWTQARLQELAQDLYRHVCARQVQPLRATCQTIGELAGAMKWDALAVLARDGAVAIARAKSSDLLLPLVEKLIDACVNASSATAAATAKPATKR
jgi:DNA-binding NarL/FixJ family response regulator